jgi:hypothetical protein
MSTLAPGDRPGSRQVKAVDSSKHQGSAPNKVKEEKRKYPGKMQTIPDS